MATIGLITGSGFYRLEGFEAATNQTIETRYGTVEIESVEHEGHTVVALARHGRGHERLSHQVDHKANIAGLIRAGAEAIIATSVVGMLEANLALGQSIVFDDLYFPSNRLPSGELATFMDDPGAPGRGHLILTAPFSPRLRRLLIQAAAAEGLPCVKAGCYVHVDGPRLNSRAEIAALSAIGGIALSQTCGPEAILAAERERPYATLGFAIDYANGVSENPTTAAEMSANLEAHPKVAGAIIRRLLSELDPSEGLPFDTGFIFRLG